MGNKKSKHNNKTDNKTYNKTNTDSKIIKNLKHLICDDAFSNRLVLKKYLNLFNCDVDEAENGREAINKITENGEYCIVWMDIKMPIMDGINATDVLRKNLNYKGPIIGLTGFVDRITVKKCLEVGMNYVVSKPFDRNIIHMYVEKFS